MEKIPAPVKIAIGTAGAAAGVAFGLPVAAVAGVVATATLTGGAVSTAVYAVCNWDNLSWEGAGSAFVSGAVDGYMWGGIGSAVAGVKNYVSVGKVRGNAYGESLGCESGKNKKTTIDYSYKFDRELANFNDGYQIRTTVDKDLILVQYSSSAPDASLCYWTTVDEANGITTLNGYMDKLALSKDWGNRNVVKVARIPAGTEVKYAVGTAREQLLIADPRPGGGVQYLFNKFDTDWITEVRSFSN